MNNCDHIQVTVRARVLCVEGCGDVTEQSVFLAKLAAERERRQAEAEIGDPDFALNADGIPVRVRR